MHIDNSLPETSGSSGRGRGHDGRGRGRGRGNHRGRGGGPSQGTDNKEPKELKEPVPPPLANSDASESLFNTDNSIISEEQQQAIEQAQYRNIGLVRYALKPEFQPLNDQHNMRRFVQGAIELLSPKHSSLSSDTGAKMLADLSSSIGLSRLVEIMRFPMGVDVGNVRTPMSFQYVMVPLMGLLTAEKVIMTMFAVPVNRIYAMVQDEILTQGLGERLTICLEQLLDRGIQNGIHDRRLRIEPGMTFIADRFDLALLCVIRLVYQALTRSRTAASEKPMQDMVERLGEICKRWKEERDPNKEKSKDNLISRDLRRIEDIISDARRHTTLIENAQATTDINIDRMRRLENGKQKAAAQLQKLFYDPPGILSEFGPRHDNDSVNIADISVIPTEEEILSRRDPFLPSNADPTARHFLVPSWAKQMDIHFRLFREDAINAFRQGIQVFLDYLQKHPDSSPNGSLQKITSNKEASLTIYPDVSFVDWRIKNRDMAALIAFRQPTPFKGSSMKTKGQRENFWEQSVKRLMPGGLVCVLVAEQLPAKKIKMNLFFAVVSQKNIGELAKNEDFARITLSFADPQRAFEKLLVPPSLLSTRKSFLLETSGVFFEAYRPVLEALQNPYTPSSSLPFGRYLAPNSTEMEEMRTRIATNDRYQIIDLPIYARAPDHRFDLTYLLNEGNGQLFLQASSSQSRTNAIQRLVEASSLDYSQAEALVSALASEVAIIQGPPGTGKTKVGLDIMRALVAEKQFRNIGPILVICYTNHALDQFLELLIKSGIENIVRVGSRSQSKDLEGKNLFTLSSVAQKPWEHRKLVGVEMARFEKVDKRIKDIGGILTSNRLPWNDLSIHLAASSYEQFEAFTGADTTNNDDQTEDEEWNTIGNNEERIFSRWIRGDDLIEKEQMKKNTRLNKKSKKEKKNPFELLNDEEREFQTPAEIHIPMTDRPLEELQFDSAIWDMSLTERERLYQHWADSARQLLASELKDKLKEAAEIRKTIDGIHDETLRRVIKANYIVGLTTNGAAKYQELLRSVSPSIIMIEEAGEVIEAHTLSTLSPSVQQIILIGDHMQLRPQVATYNLSIESKAGKQHKLDVSLFERLVTGGFGSEDIDRPANLNLLPRSTLLTQRRMRPEISRLIRGVLYKDLKDGENTTKYPPVRGFSSNVHFFDHKHRENDGKKDAFALQSFSNAFEVEMITELVKYLIKQGYTRPNDIAVLTPYLSQFRLLRNHLRETVTVEIDERDAREVAEMDQEEGENNNIDLDDIDTGVSEDVANARTAANIKIERKKLSQQVTLRTIDNFQGEEATIVILSLVRNNTHGSIGFLQSVNRMNVAITRAKEGMFIFGNSELLRGSPHWSKVLSALEEQNQLFHGIPLRCQMHSEYENIVTTVQELRIAAPDGGCQERCGFSLPCGHTCPNRCHPGDARHLTTICSADCLRRRKTCHHVCMKRCGEPCGRCEEHVDRDIPLPCGHSITGGAQCWIAQDPSSFICHEKVMRKIKTCEHEVSMSCSSDPAKAKCDKKCGRSLPCGHPCGRPCVECTKASQTNENQEDVVRDKHGPCIKPCDRILFCQHYCKEICHESTACPPCKAKCARRCQHQKCSGTHSCAKGYCAPCAEPCTWICECVEGGSSCTLTCGAPCAGRNPCNNRCQKLLECHHQCPSLCGEPCPTKKYCFICAPENVREQTVDLIMLETFGDLAAKEGIILPLSCGHAFTPEFLDGLMELGKFFEELGSNAETGFTTYGHPLEFTDEVVDNKACPHCRSPIEGVNRYKRRTTRAHIEVQMKKEYQRLGSMMKTLQDKLSMAEVLVHSNVPIFTETVSKFKENETLNSKLDMGIHGRMSDSVKRNPPSKDLISKALELYEIEKDASKLFIKHVQPLRIIYNELCEFIEKIINSPIKKAFDSATAFLYHRKVRDFARYTEFNNEELVKQCEFECGIPSPKPQNTTEYVLALQECANTIISIFDHACKPLAASMPSSKIWLFFSIFFLETAEQHIENMEAMAVKAKLNRHISYALLLRASTILRHMRLFQIRSTSSLYSDNERVNLLQNYVKSADNLFRRAKMMAPEGILNEIEEKAETLQKQIKEAFNRSRGEFYESVSNEETISVLRAMATEFRGAGHWYRCPQGHLYTIGECGMAMQQSFCPECGAAVGGGNHQLLGNNNAATDIERRLYES